MEVIINKVVEELANGGKKITTIYQDEDTKKLRYETKEEGVIPPGSTGFYVKEEK